MKYLDVHYIISKSCRVGCFLIVREECLQKPMVNGAHEHRRYERIHLKKLRVTSNANVLAKKNGGTDEYD